VNVVQAKLQNGKNTKIDVKKREEDCLVMDVVRATPEDALVAGWFCGGLGGDAGGGGAFYRVSFIVEADYILCDVGRGEKDRGVLRGVVQDSVIAVAGGVAHDDVHDFAADGVDYVALSVVEVVLKFILFAFQLLRKPLPLQGQASLFFVSESVRAGGEALLKIADLFIEGLELFSAGQELRFQLSRSLLAFGGTGDSLTQVDGTDFRAGVCSGLLLRRQRGGGQRARENRSGYVDDRSDFHSCLLKMKPDSGGWNVLPDEFRTCAGGCDALVRAASCL
jgi:hypothetical protein